MSVIQKQSNCFVFRIGKTDFKCCISHEPHLRVIENTIAPIFPMTDYFTFKIPAIREFDTGDIAVGYW